MIKKILFLSLFAAGLTQAFADEVFLNPGTSVTIKAQQEATVSCKSEAKDLPICSFKAYSGYSITMAELQMRQGYDTVYYEKCSGPDIKSCTDEQYKKVLEKIAQFKSLGLCKTDD